LGKLGGESADAGLSAALFPNVMSGVNLVANVYLDDNTAKIRVKPVPWEV
jgi:hypothetical protein